MISGIEKQIVKSGQACIERGGSERRGQAMISLKIKKRNFVGDARSDRKQWSF